MVSLSNMYDEIYASLFEIVTFFNRPKQDSHLLSRAGVSLDHTFFPLLMTVQQKGPIGLVKLASNVNKDYTTVSRQIDALVGMGLVRSERAGHDRRVRHIIMTDKGRNMVAKIADARRVMMREHLRSWSQEDIEKLRSALEMLARSLA